MRYNKHVEKGEEYRCEKNSLWYPRQGSELRLSWLLLEMCPQNRNKRMGSQWSGMYDKGSPWSTGRRRQAGEISHTAPKRKRILPDWYHWKPSCWSRSGRKRIQSKEKALKRLYPNRFYWYNECVQWCESAEQHVVLFMNSPEQRGKAEKMPGLPGQRNHNNKLEQFSLLS